MMGHIPPDWYREWERRSRRYLAMSIAAVLICLAALVAILLLSSQAKGETAGAGTCWVSEAHSTAVWYVPSGDNTAVLMIAYCPGVSTPWYVSFFADDQPSLWEWYEIQNTASELVRGG